MKGRSETLMQDPYTYSGSERMNMASCPFPELAKYKNLFGEPGSTKGMRKYRIFNIALYDTFIVLVFAYIFSLFNKYPFWMNAVGLLILGVIVHRMFCVRTAVDRMIFG